VRLARDPAGLRAAAAAELISAEAACRKTLAVVAESTGHLEERSSAFHVIKTAERLLERELRRRRLSAGPR
jgi:hypothetical protein